MNWRKKRWEEEDIQTDKEKEKERGREREGGSETEEKLVSISRLKIIEKENDESTVIIKQKIGRKCKKEKNEKRGKWRKQERQSLKDCFLSSFFRKKIPSMLIVLKHLPAIKLFH